MDFLTNFDKIYDTCKDYADKFNMKTVTLNFYGFVLKKSEMKLTGNELADPVVLAFNSCLSSLYSEAIRYSNNSEVKLETIKLSIENLKTKIRYELARN